MSDSTSIKSVLRAQFPGGIPNKVDGVMVLITGEEYERRLDEMVVAIMERASREETRQDDAAVNAQVKAALTTLNTHVDLLQDGAPTIAQMRAMLALTDRVLIGLIRTLRGVIGDAP